MRPTAMINTLYASNTLNKYDVFNVGYCSLLAPQ